MPQLYKRKGADVLVNTVTTGNQSGPNIAQLLGGGYIIVWTDGSATGGDTSSFGIKAQRFDADGVPVGGEFLVNTTTLNGQTGATVFTFASGRFIISWNDASATGGDTSGGAVRAQIFEADGTLAGGEFLVNTETANGQSSPTIAELSGGGFVIGWQDSSLIGGDASGSGIKAQLFNAAGAKVGGEILVNTTTTGSQTAPSIIALASGGFAVAWTGATSFNGTAIVGSIRLQLFDAAGVKVGIEQVVNSVEEGNFFNTTIAALQSGFVVTWSQQDSTPHPGVTVTYNVKAQLFDADGVKIGGDFTVNTTTAGTQSVADVDALPGGGFIVTWQGPGEGSSGFNIYGQIFDAAGARVGVEFVLSSVTDANQLSPKVEVLPSGDIVVVFSDSSGIGGDTSNGAIKAQILTPTNDPPTDILLSGTTISETAREDMALATLDSVGAVNSGYTYVIVSDSSGGAFGIDGDKLVVVDNTLLDFETTQQVEVRIRATDDNGNSYEETIQLAIADTPEAGYAAATDEFLVNTTTQDNQSEPVITPLESGGFVAIWADWPISGGTIVGKAQIYDSAGDPVGGEILVEGTSAAALPGGGFVTTWSEFGGPTDLTEIRAQVYDAAGAAVGGEISVNTSVAGDQIFPSVAVLAGGGFVVTWADYSGAPTTGIIRAQLFDSGGTKLGVELSVTPFGGISEVAALASGDFVIVWAGGGAIMAQMYTASGVRLGLEFEASSPGTMTEPHVTALASGGFVVTYARNISSGGFTGIDRLSAQVFDANGIRVGDEILIDAGGPAQVASSDVAALPWGGFVVSWAGYENPPTSDTGIRAQVFDGSGAKIGDEIVVNEETLNNQIHPDLAVLESGEFVIAWSDQSGLGGDASGMSVKARIFDLDPNLGGTFVGTTGDETLTGTPGNDTFDGVAGNDTLEGGNGDDIYYVRDPDTIIVEAAGQGRDAAYSSVSYTLGAGAHVEVLSTDSIAGTAALNLAGNGFNNEIYGNNGANLLNGGGGGDYLVGWGGDDIYLIFSGSEIIVENANSGRDAVYTAISYALAADTHVEVLSTDSIAATTAINLTGNGFNNEIYGNNGANLLNGGGGGDYLVGWGGDDIYLIFSGSEIVVENANSGRDVVYTAISYALAAHTHVEALAADSIAATTAINLTGNGFNNEIYGNNGANLLNGGGGGDYLVGWGGDDIYLIFSGSEIVVENASSGRDVVYTAISYGLAADTHVEVLAANSIVETAAINLTGNGLNNEIYGNNGANLLNGGGGAGDYLVGWGGDDVYLIFTGHEIVVENANSGRDAVYTTVSYALAAGTHVEVLSTDSIAGTNGIDLTGNELGNELYGNNGANVLNGGGAADYMLGHGGADSFAFTTALGGGNVDVLADFSAADDTILLENAVFTGLAAGALPASAFVTGAAAGDANDRIVYNSATGQIFFDADGSDPGAAVHFATVNAGTILTASDFTVI